MSDEEDGAPPLVGGWRLVDWVSIADDGSETSPLGAAPHGLLTYSRDGTMVAIMTRSDRARFATDDLTGGSPAEQAGAFASCIAYGGAFELDGDTVVHRVETSLFPNWVGTEQRRRWGLDPTGRVLTLTSPPLAMGGVSRIQRLTWLREGA